MTIAVRTIAVRFDDGEHVAGAGAGVEEAEKRPAQRRLRQRPLHAARQVRPFGGHQRAHDVPVDGRHE